MDNQLPLRCVHRWICESPVPNLGVPAACLFCGVTRIFTPFTDYDLGMSGSRSPAALKALASSHKAQAKKRKAG